MSFIGIVALLCKFAALRTMKNQLRAAIATLGSLLFGSTSLGEDAGTYASVRTEVSVELGQSPATDLPRPANYFQLAGAADPQLCDDVLKAFNEPGRFHGEDTNRWLLDNSRHIDFASLNPQAAPGTQYVFPDLEYARIDVDGDGNDEHVYRSNNVLGSQWVQRLMIVPDQLQQESIVSAMRARVPDRLANEWMFTKNSVLSWVTSDKASHELIYISRNQLRRNLGDTSSTYWALYEVSSRVLAVAAPPPFSFAPPEFLVFVPSKERNGDLKCVLMPRAWRRPEAAAESEP